MVGKRRYGLVLVWGGLFLFYGLTGCFRTIPLIVLDEVAYIGIARYLSGSGPLPRFGNSPYYHFGYSLVLSPLIRLFRDPATLYAGIMWMNAFLMSSLCVPVYLLLHRHFSIERRTALLSAFVVGLYPSFFAQTNFAWSENLFIPVFACLMVVFGELLDRDTPRFAVIFGFLGAGLYAIHPRALPLIPLVVATLLLLRLLGALSWKSCLSGISAATAATAAVVLTHRHLLALGWTRPGHAVMGMLRTVSDSGGGLRYVENLLGQAWYLSSATLGLAVLGLVYAMHLGLAHTRGLGNILRDKGFQWVVFLLSASGGILAASALKMMNPSRGDHVIYGRYNEGFIALWIGFGVAFLGSGLTRSRKLRLCLVSCGVMTALAWGFAGIAGTVERHVVSVNVVGLAPILHGLRHMDMWGWLPVVGLLGPAAALLMTGLSLRSFRIAAVPAAVWFLLIGVPYAHKIMKTQDEILFRTRMAEVIRALPNTGIVAYDRKRDVDERDNRPYHAFQWVLPDVEFRSFNSGREPVPVEDAWVLAQEDWKPPLSRPAVLLCGDAPNRMALWRLGGSSGSSNLEDLRERLIGLYPHICSAEGRTGR